MFKTSSSTTIAKQSAKTRKESNEQKPLVKTTSSVNVTNKNKTRRTSNETEATVKKKPSAGSRKSSEASAGRKASSDATSTIKRSASNASTVSVGTKSRENTFVKRSSSRHLLPQIDRDANSLVPTDEDTSVAQNDR